MIQGPSADLLANVPSFDRVVALLYVVDVLVEIFTATPSSGKGLHNTLSAARGGGVVKR